MRTGKEAGESAKTGTIIRTAMTNKQKRTVRQVGDRHCLPGKQATWHWGGVGWGGRGDGGREEGGEGRKKGEGEKTAGPKSGQEGGPPFSVTSHDR